MNIITEINSLVKMSAAPAQNGFNFRDEAIKMLRGYGANAGRATGGYSSQMGKDMLAQYNDIKSNPQKYSVDQQKAILAGWKSRIDASRTKPQRYFENSRADNARILRSERQEDERARWQNEVAKRNQERARQDRDFILRGERRNARYGRGPSLQLAGIKKTAPVEGPTISRNTPTSQVASSDIKPFSSWRGWTQDQINSLPSSRMMARFGGGVRNSPALPRQAYNYSKYAKRAPAATANPAAATASQRANESASVASRPAKAVQNVGMATPANI